MHDELDLWSLKDGPVFKGKDYEPQYEVPSPAATHLEADEGTQLHHGNCHCGAVTYTLRYKPTAEMELNNCNCSICARVSSSLSHYSSIVP